MEKANVLYGSMAETSPNLIRTINSQIQGAQWTSNKISHTQKKKISRIPAYRVTQGTFSSVQLLNCVRLFVTPWITARQVSLSITNSRNLLKLMSIKSVRPSNHLILCHPLVLLPSIFPSIRVYSNESAVHIGWPEYWSIGIRHIIEC